MFHVTAETRAELKALRARRDKTDRRIELVVRRARDEGGSLREIGDLIGLSHTEVRRIVERGNPAD